MDQLSVELRHLDGRTSNGNNQQQNSTVGAEDSRNPSTEFTLPPVDGGKDAWLVLAACWGVEAVTFGKT
jgi:hypothetical protein